MLQKFKIEIYFDFLLLIGMMVRVLLLIFFSKFIFSPNLLKIRATLVGGCTPTAKKLHISNPWTQQLLKVCSHRFKW
jgi:hypothetical protein